MQITKTLEVATRQEWRQWLKQHYKTESEIWLVYFRKHTGKPRIEYNDAVEEALCFGWIDSIEKGLDDERIAQRFSPRKNQKNWSPTNIVRLRKLVKQKKVISGIMETLPDLSEDAFKIPADILKAIKANPAAWKHFQNFSPAYKEIRIGYIEGARKRPAEFKKRLANFIAKTADNKQFGYGGVEKNY